MNPLIHRPKILLVAEELGFIHQIKKLLTQASFPHVLVANNGVDAIHTFRNSQPDICLIGLLLEQQIPGLIELGQQIRRQNQEVALVFISALYTEAIYQRLRPLKLAGFLQRTLTPLRLHTTIDMALLGQADSKSRQVKTREPADTYYFKVGDSYKQLYLKEIAYFFTREKSTYARINRRNYPLNVSLRTLEFQFSPTFVRIHKSFLVNKAKVHKINTQLQKVEIEGELIPMSSAFRKKMFQTFTIVK